eukprot:9400168-Alexandrium_andersonii.AAC.1
MDLLHSLVAECDSAPHSNPSLAKKGVMIYDYRKELHKKTTVERKRGYEKEVGHDKMSPDEFDK